MFSTDKYVNFALEAQRLANNYGIHLVIDWEKGVLDFQGKYTPQELLSLANELTDLAKLYGMEEH